jgi:hypothetical protein
MVTFLDGRAASTARIRRKSLFRKPSWFNIPERSPAKALSDRGVEPFLRSDAGSTVAPAKLGVNSGAVERVSTFPMKIPVLALVTVGLVGSGLLGCSKQTRTEATVAVKDAYTDAKSAAIEAWDSVKSFSFEQREKFGTKARAMSAKMDAQVSQLQAEYSEEKASASRRAAMEELKNSEADYKQKVAAMGTATAATWESTKQSTIAAWDRLEVAYYKALEK